jgi:meso-butanediol dehydrogenase / (S,S)-butanediol dehydrogenase / diacetyl reductase
MHGLKGVVAVITGSGRGIGEQIARRYASEGARLVIADINEDAVLSLSEELQREGVDVLPLTVDVADPGAATRLIAESTGHFGRIDVLVNNAGVIRVKRFLETTPEDWDYMQNVNARGLFFCVQACAKQMLSQTPLADGRPTGKIINMASIAGRAGRKFMCAYSASKAAVIMITQSAASECSPKVTVNSICPGPVDTDMWIQIDAEWTAIENKPIGTAWRERVQAVPMARAQTSEDVASMAYFLASKDSDFITGQSYHVDGGVLML